jgi:hypothetical protein
MVAPGFAVDSASGGLIPVCSIFRKAPFHGGWPQGRRAAGKIFAGVRFSDTQRCRRQYGQQAIIRMAFFPPGTDSLSSVPGLCSATHGMDPANVVVSSVDARVAYGSARGILHPSLLNPSALVAFNHPHLPAPTRKASHEACPSLPSCRSGPACHR